MRGVAASSRSWSNARPRGEYASTAEYRLALRLDLLLAAHLLDGWEYIGDDRSQRYPLVVNGVVVCTYLPDFRATWSTPAGPQWALVEVKGRKQREWPVKRRLFRALNPDLPLHVVQSADVDVYNPDGWRGE